MSNHLSTWGNITANKAPFHLPAGFLQVFDYPGHRRLVALYWEPCADQACYDDGVMSACGCCDNWLYLGFICQPQVSEWLDQHGINLGNSDEPATRWLVVDVLTSEAYAAALREARDIVRRQELPGQE